MAKKEYGYLGEIRGSEIVYRPIIGIALQYGNKRSTTIALIDSGSDRTVIDAGFAVDLGIDASSIPKGKMAGAVGTATESFMVSVDVKIDGFDDAFPMDVSFVKGLNTGALLGQKDFFDLFKVSFEKRRRKFYLEQEE